MHSRYGFLHTTDVYIHSTFSPSRHSYSRDSSSTPWSHLHCLATTCIMRATTKDFSVLLFGWKSSHSSHTTTVFTTSTTLKTQQLSDMNPFGNLFGSGFRSDRSSSRRYTHGGHDNYGRSSSSRLNEPFNMPYGDYRTTSRREESDNSTLRRAASQREPYDNRYNYRDVSPIRASERPRAFTHKHAYDDHRSVSPLGTSRFEQPSMATRQFSASNMGGTLSDLAHLVRRTLATPRGRPRLDSTVATMAIAAQRPPVEGSFAAAQPTVGMLLAVGDTMKGTVRHLVASTVPTLVRTFDMVDSTGISFELF
jgi:hypothetical protein